MSLLDFLDAERFDFGRGDDRSGVLDQEVHLGGRLIDRQHERARAGRERVRIADLLHPTRRNRREHDHAVMAELHRVARNVALAGAKLSDTRGDSPRPGRGERIGGHARRRTGVFQLEDLEYLARALRAGACHRRQPARQADRRTRTRRGERDEIFNVNGPTGNVQRQREVGDAVIPHADRVLTRAVRIAQHQAVATASVAAHRVQGTGTVARQAVQDHPGVRERHRIAPASQRTPAHADGGMLSLGGQHAEGAEPDQGGATA
ncbi:MAG: hypothetical protein DMD58_03645 [Gemmatimonadetes bacterium]|nr:MAG: hypothetical protein DMD58_03645 [Gemmatimonadota bacterium]